jgi:hypothetical protein
MILFAGSIVVRVFRAVPESVRLIGVHLNTMRAEGKPTNLVKSLLGVAKRHGAVVDACDNLWRPTSPFPGGGASFP